MWYLYMVMCDMIMGWTIMNILNMMNDVMVEVVDAFMNAWMNCDGMNVYDDTSVIWMGSNICKWRLMMHVCDYVWYIDEVDDYEHIEYDEQCNNTCDVWWWWCCIHWCFGGADTIILWCVGGADIWHAMVCWGRRHVK